jgi:hypothetical protein
MDLRRRVSLICGKLVEARSLSLVLRQAATTVLVKETKLILCPRVSLFCGEPITGGLALVLRQQT